MNHAALIGRGAEAAAEKLLKAKAIVILERNFRTPSGEIDIVGQDGDEVVFVEVRMRKSDSHGSAAATVDSSKRKKIIKTASIWIKSKSWNGPCRFDVIAVDASHIEHIAAAFTADDQ